MPVPVLRGRSLEEEIDMAASVLERIRNVEHLKAKVKTDTLRKVKRVLNELNKLGFDYRIVGDSSIIGKGNGRVNGSTKRASRTVKDAPCKICGFRTAKPHDARAHRGQSKKSPFTRKELAERGLRRV
jgi:hypothetical protein